MWKAQLWQPRRPNLDPTVLPRLGSFFSQSVSHRRDCLINARPPLSAT